MKKLLFAFSIFASFVSITNASDFSPLTMSGNIYVTSGYVGDTIGASVTSVIETLKINDTVNMSPWSIHENSHGGGWSYLDDISP